MIDIFKTAVTNKAYQDTKTQLFKNSCISVVKDEHAINLAKLLNKQKYTCANCGSDWTLFHSMDAMTNTLTRTVSSYCYNCQTTELVWDGQSDEVKIKGKFE